MPTHRNSNMGHWKELIFSRCESIKLSTGAKVENSIEEKLNSVQSEVSFATAGNTAYSNLQGASCLTVNKYFVL
ncbi:hypothetical protein ACFLTE_11905 [Bacteroidota bacterium]